MIYTFVPFSHTKNLGKAYNDYCRLVNDDDWIVMKDADVMFLTPDYEVQIKEMIDKYPNTGIFTCLTNRVGELEQCYGGKISENSDIKYHRALANKLKADKRATQRKGVISGMVMVFKKSTWNKVGGFKEDLKLLGVDNAFSLDVLNLGMDIKIIQGLYVFHYYRLIEGAKSRNHLR